MFKLISHNKSFSSLATTERSKSFIIYNKKKNFENIFKNKKRVLEEILKNLNVNLNECNKLNSNKSVNNLLNSNKNYNKIFNDNVIKILKENDYYDKKFSINNNNNNNNFYIKSYLDKNNNNNNNNKIKYYYNYKGELLSNFSKLKYIYPPKKIVTNSKKKNRKKTNFSSENSNVNFLNDLYIINKDDSNNLNKYKYNLLKNFNDFIENSEKFNNYYECNSKIKDDMIKQKVGINYPGNLILLKENLEKYNSNFDVIQPNCFKKYFKKKIHVPLNSFLPKPKIKNFSYFPINKIYNDNNLLL
jgi:hypothetical protein